MDILQHINWELVTFFITLLSGIFWLIRSQMIINKEIFVTIASIKKDIEMNAEMIKENKLDNQTSLDKLIDLMDRLFDKNNEQLVQVYEKLDNCDGKIDKITDYIINDKLCHHPAEIEALR